jgi:hypothetical protein
MNSGFALQERHRGAQRNGKTTELWFVGWPRPEPRGRRLLRSKHRNSLGADRHCTVPPIGSAVGGNGSVKVASDSTLSEWNALAAGVEVALAGSEALRIVRTDTKHDNLLP